MTMQNSTHPDDELLAAYAGGDSDALADPSLVAHLSVCDRCRPLVDELSLLRGALAELPDLAPSRPLRLIPPVPAPAARGSWLRRLTAPAMAAGAGLILVGAIGIGASGDVGRLLGQAASGAFQNVGDNLQAAGASDREATPSDRAFGQAPGSAGTPMATLDGSKGTDSAGASQPPSVRSSGEASPTVAPHLANGSSAEQPWLTLLIAGAGLFGVSTALRFSLSPRAG